MRRAILALAVGAALLTGGAFAQNAAHKYEGQWRSSKLIGVNVYNNANEKIGDINELILDKSGKVENVVIGVGGFLGMGEHDVAVSFDKLKFVDKPVENRTSDTRPTNEARPATTGSAAGTSSSHNWYPDHVVLDATKDQLKAMPQFKYSNYN